MTREEITNICWGYCENHFHISRVFLSEESDFYHDFLTDPLDHHEMIEFVFESFEIVVSDEEMYAVLTFADLINLIEGKQI